MDTGRRGFLAATERFHVVALDTNACIYYLQGQPCADLVAALIERAVSGSLRIVLSALVQLELLVRPYQSGDLVAVRRILQFTEQHAGIETCPITREVVLRTAQLRGVTRLKTPDALVAASASVFGAEAIIGNDGDFLPLNHLPALRMLGGPSRMPAFVRLGDYLE